jgi:hypothetical protein
MIRTESKTRLRREAPLVLRFDTIESALKFCETCEAYYCLAYWLRLVEGL